MRILLFCLLSFFLFIDDLLASSKTDFYCNIDVDTGLTSFELYGNDKADYYGVAKASDPRYDDTISVYNIQKCDEIASGTQKDSKSVSVLMQNGYVSIATLSMNDNKLVSFDRWLKSAVTVNMDTDKEEVIVNVKTFDSVLHAYRYNKQMAISKLQSQNNIDDLVACYRSEMSFEYYLKAYELSKSSDDLYSAYEIASTEDKLSKIYELAQSNSDTKVKQLISTKLVDLYRSKQTYEGYIKAYQISSMIDDLYSALEQTTSKDKLYELLIFTHKAKIDNQKFIDTMINKYFDFIPTHMHFSESLNLFKKLSYKNFLNKAISLATTLEQKSQLEKGLVEHIGILKIFEISSHGEIISNDTENVNYDMVLYNSIQKDKNLKHEMQILLNNNSPIELKYNTYMITIQFVLKLRYRYVMKKALFGLDYGQTREREVVINKDFIVTPNNGYKATKIVDFGSINQGGKQSLAFIFKVENSLQSAEVDYDIISWSVK